MITTDKLRRIANDIDWHVFNHGGIPYELREIANEIDAENEKLHGEGKPIEEIVFGSPEHIAGLSREALESDFRYVVDRNKELEGLVDEFAAENKELRERMDDMRVFFELAMRELGIEVD